MTQTIMFQGSEHSFPDNTTQSDIQKSLEQHKIGILESMGQGIKSGATDLLGSGLQALENVRRVPGLNPYDVHTPIDYNKMISDTEKESLPYVKANPLSYNISKFATQSAPWMLAAPEGIISNTALSALQGYAQYTPDNQNHSANALLSGATTGGVSSALKGLQGVLAGVVANTQTKKVISNNIEISDLQSRAAKVLMENKSIMDKAMEDNDLNKKTANIIFHNTVNDSPLQTELMNKMLSKNDEIADTFRKAKRNRDIAEVSISDLNDMHQSYGKVNSRLEEVLAASGKGSGLIKTKTLVRGDDEFGEYSPLELAYFNLGASKLGPIANILTNPIVAPVIGAMHSGPIGAGVGMLANMSKNALVSGEVTPKFLQSLNVPKGEIPWAKVKPENVMESAHKYGNEPISKIANYVIPMAGQAAGNNMTFNWGEL